MKTIEVKEFQISKRIKLITKQPVTLASSLLKELKSWVEHKINLGKTIGLMLTMLIVGGITSCASSNQKVDDAKEDVKEAEENLKKAQEEYAMDVARFKKESEERIAVNEERIKELNEKIAQEKADKQVVYKEQVTTLEQKNRSLKKRMEEYKADRKEQWTSFKEEFRYDMDELDKALKNMTIDNKK